MEEKRIAKNGVEIYTYKNESLHGFFISLFVRAGSVYESGGDLGITHFLEHVAIRNVNKLMGGGLYRELDRNGLEFNACTYQDFVQFYVSGSSERFSVGSEILLGLFSPITLAVDEINAERKRIKAEIRESDERNSLTAFSNSIVYSGSPLANPILGTNKTVDGVTRRRLEDYRKKVFSRERIFFYATGNFKDSDIDALCEQVGALPVNNGEPLCTRLELPKGFLKRDGGVYIKNADYTMLKFTFDIEPELAERPECDIIYDMLLSGYSSRFFIEMSENRGMFYDINGSLDRFPGLATFTFSYEVKERDIYRATELSLEILQSFVAGALCEREVIRAPYTTNAYMLYDDAREFNFTYAYENRILGRNYRTVEDRIAEYAAVTAESVREVAGRIFRRENLTLTVKGKRTRIDQKRLSDIISKL